MADIRVKFVAQKISKIRWRPSFNKNLQASDVFATGNWDDEENRVCMWQLPSPSPDTDMEGLDTITDAEPQKLCDAPHQGDVTDLQFTGPEHMVTASSAGTVTLYRHHRNSQTLGVAGQWENIHHFPGSSPCQCTCVARQGEDLVVSSGEDGRINVLNLNHRKPVRTIDKADSCTVNAIEFLKQLEVMTVNSSGQLKIFDLRQTSDEPSKIFSVTGEQTALHCVSQHPSQQHVVATGGQDGVLCVWDLRQDKFPVTLLEAHSSIMWEVRFHPSNPDHLFTCSEDGSVWHWDCSAVSTVTGAGGGPSLFGSHVTGVGGASVSSPWLSLDTSRQKMEITTLLPNQSLPVNTLDIDSNTLLCGTDEEAIYTIHLPAMR